MEEQNRNKATAPGEARRPSSVEEAEAAIEAVLFAMGDSVELGRIAKAIGHDTETTRRILNHMMEKYNTKDRGIHIVELENAYQMCTKQEYYDYLVNIAMQPKKAVLTDVMMETLSIIAYKQPVTKQEIDKIRGVKSDHAVNKLVEYNLVQELGRLDAPGRPIVFGTTEEFLRNFGVDSTDNLPEISHQNTRNGVILRSAASKQLFSYDSFKYSRQKNRLQPILFAIDAKRLYNKRTKELYF